MAEWKLLPAEPTEDQLRAGNNSALSTETLMDDTRFACERATYRAMYAAAPSPSPADDLREKVARIIDPRETTWEGFKSDEAYKKAALGNADAVLALLQQAGK